MAGEYIRSQSIKDYWEQVKQIYSERASEWKDLTVEEYTAIDRSEREDSDNHLNEERLGKDTQVIDICHYKFLPGRIVAYHIEIIHADGTKEQHYFQLTLKVGTAIN